MKVIQQGKSVSEGIGIGKAYIYKQYSPNVQAAYIDPDKASEEIASFERVQKKAEREIKGIIEYFNQIQDDKAKIFEAHLEMLNDIMIVEEIHKQIEKSHYTYAYAIKQTFDQFIEMFDTVDNVMINERTADLKDIRNRLLRISQGLPEMSLATFDQPTIIIAHDLYPSDTASLDRNHVQGIITEIGGKTSHTAIIAKDYQIPAMIGVSDVFTHIKDGDRIIIDAIEGKIFIQPEASITEDFINQQKKYLFEKELEKKYLTAKPVTKDQVHVELSINIGSSSDEELENEPHIDGIGLFRSEFLYMDKRHLPTEDQQFEIYKKVLKKFGSKPVIIRTLDIGGDKKLDVLSSSDEENPFLGNRAIRLCFDHPDMFKTQIRALLRASVYGNLWMMFPMVGSMDDINRLKQMVEEVKHEMTKDKIAYNPDYRFGIMIEIPSIVMIADHVAEAVDFASIGSNDLCQYLEAVDRLNPNVTEYYQSYAPSVFRTIKMAIDAFHRAQKPISICGELGGDPISVPILLGMGMRKLSMNQSSVSSIKHLIATNEMSLFEHIADQALKMKTEAEISSFVQTELAKAKEESND